MRKPTILLAGAACLPLLAGCGSTGPNVAATVGETTISMSTVDDLAVDYCTATAPAYEQNGVVLPMGTVRRQVLTSLVRREIARQIGEAYDVSPGQTYDRVVQLARTQADSLPDAQRDAVLTVDTTGGYLQDLAIAVAEADLEEQGVTGLSRDQVTEKALDLFTNWSDRAPVEVNPKLGVDFDQGQFVPIEDGSLSVGVSEEAESAGIVQRFENAADQQEQIDLAQQLTGYARTLPESQRCG